MRLVLLGDPVEHSLSPILHEAALHAAGIEGSYTARRVDDAGMRIAVEELRTEGIDGANVTMPHKTLAHDLVDHVGVEAARTGAVNTLSRAGMTVVGDNTDVAGIRTAWREASLPERGPVLILGAGGAAAAALVALAGRDLLISARRLERAESLCRSVGVAATPIAWGTEVPGVVVNATPIGMKGETLPGALLGAATGLFEMAYGSAPTPAEQAASAAGLPVVSGLDMLLAQAAVSFQIWTGVPAPTSAMRAALNAAIAART